MKIYSIQEIVKATNELLKPELKNKIKKNIKKSQDELPPNTESIISEAERTLISKKKITKI